MHGLTLWVGEFSSDLGSDKASMLVDLKEAERHTELLAASYRKAVSLRERTLFRDVPEGHWAFDSVQTLKDLGIPVGYPDGRFRG